MSRLLAALLTIFAASAFANSAHSADVLSPMPVKTVAAPVPATAWTFHSSLYLWAPGLKGDVALGPLAPPVSIDADFGDILDAMKMAAMGSFEARYGRYGFLSDISYLAVEVSATGPLGFVDAKLDDKTFFGTFVGTYRAFEQPTWWLDVVGGARVWWRSDELTITGPVRTITASRDKSWVDPVIGLRARAYFSPQVFVQVYGDYGGFGVGAKSDWQVVGLLGYQYNATTSFFGGYRYLSVDYNNNGYVFDVSLSGPIFGASFKF
jgi:hypothetical protein